MRVRKEIRRISLRLKREPKFKSKLKVLNIWLGLHLKRHTYMAFLNKASMSVLESEQLPELVIGEKLFELNIIRRRKTRKPQKSPAPIMDKTKSRT